MSAQVRLRSARRIIGIATMGFLIAVTGNLAAQTRPDAGSILRDIEAAPLPARPVVAPQRIDPVGDDPVAADLGVRVRVQGFRITGATLLPVSELLGLLDDLLGRELSLAQLKLAARRVADHYRNKGFVARAYLPRQTIEAGMVEIAVIEARLGAVEILDPRPQRASVERARRILLEAQAPGTPLLTAEVLHALYLINETPGFAATAITRPGKQEGDTDVLLKLEDTALVSGSVQADNQGSDSTGAERALVSVSLNNPSGGGDQGSLTVLATSGTRFARLGWSLPLGYQGTRLGVTGTVLDYRLGGTFANLRAQGSARIESISLTHAALRSAQTNLSLSCGIDQKHYINDANLQNTSDKRVGLVTLGAGAEWQDALDGHWNGNVNLVIGRADLSGNRADFDADQATAKAHGGFGKAGFGFSRSQKLDEHSSIAISASGQWADGNLDSGEKFSLGGGSALRAYPSGEASGDEGWLASLEWRQRFSDEVQVVAFLDAGGIRLHRQTWLGWNSSNPNQGNAYVLNGAGLTAAWRRAGDFAMSLTLAARLGRNPGVDAGGKDSDGRARGYRWWWQLSKSF